MSKTTCFREPEGVQITEPISPEIVPGTQSTTNERALNCAWGLYDACFRSRSSGGSNDDGEGEDGSCLFVLITRGFCPLDWIWTVNGLLPGSGWPKPNQLTHVLVHSHACCFYNTGLLQL